MRDWTWINPVMVVGVWLGLLAYTGWMMFSSASVPMPKPSGMTEAQSAYYEAIESAHYNR